MTSVFPVGELSLSKLHGLGNDFLVVLRSETASAAAAAAPELSTGVAAVAAGAGPADAAVTGATPGPAGAPVTDTPVTGTPVTGTPVTDTPVTGTTVTDTPVTGAALARRLCDRHLGIGADGLILGTRLTLGPPGAVPAGGSVLDPLDASLRFQLWNADGSEAEMSGNGIRCLAHAALDAGWVLDDVSFGVITPAGRREVRIRRASEAGWAWASVEMGEAKVRGEVERCNIGHGQLLVDTGNPHLVVLGPDPATVDVPALGPMLEATDPAGLNVEFVALGPGPDEVTMRVWERGVGETRACGTGACAAAAALYHWGRVGRTVTVHQPGGSAAVELRSDGSVTLGGPSVHIAACRVLV